MNKLKKPLQMKRLFDTNQLSITISVKLQNQLRELHH